MVPPETERTQTAVMTIGPGQDGGPEETHAGDQVVFAPPAYQR